MRFIFTLLSFLILTPTLHAQDSNAKKQQIAKAITDYFHMERENIHVHLNKGTFLTTENIWFKGYVFHRKGAIPFFQTTNIYATLLDAEGKVINSQLLYGNLASFSGAFELDDSFKSGKYYLQFYTNWMNNFIEDESAVYEVNIINPAQGAATALSKPDHSKINISFHPEGGTLVKDAVNSLGVSVSDCLHNPIGISSLDIVNSAGEILKTVQINKSGHGRFELPANAPAGLKAVLKTGSHTHTQALPPAEMKGVALEVNNYSFPDKMIVKLRTNSLTNTALTKKSLFLVVQQDEKFLIHEFSFADGIFEQTIIIPQNDLFRGINIMRILDNDLNQIAGRLIFKNTENQFKSEFSKAGKDHQYSELKGKINYPATNVSISVLPDATAALTNTGDIYGSLLIAPYLDTQQKIAGRYFLESFSKIKHYELDLLLLSHEEKYKWRDIIKNTPKTNYTFDMGLSLKATLNNKLAPNKKYKVRVLSVGGMLDEQVDINAKNEIILDNVIIADSSLVRFSLLENGVKKQELKLYPQVFNNKKTFNKQYKPFNVECSYSPEDSVASFDEMLPKYYKNSIMLDEIKVEADATKLKHIKSPGNAQLRPYKITETEAKSFFYILDYIRYHGFDVENNGVSVGVYGRTVNTINGQRTSPMLFMDNMQVMSFDQLQGVQTADVDEFYINQHAVVTSVNNKMGIIKLYMRRDFSKPAKGGDISDTNYIVKDGFKKVVPFENASYVSTSDKGFENFGVIDWQSVILPDAKGEFSIKIPHTSQDKIKILIEGFSADGKMISEIKTIQLQ